MNELTTLKPGARIHASIGCFLANLFDWYDLQILSLVLVLITNEFDLSLAQAGLLGTVTLVGTAVSIPVTGWIMNNKGRKASLLFSVIGFSVLTGAIAVAPSFYLVLILRAAAGICLGGIIVTVGTYMAEIWAAKIRARATTIVMMSSGLGGLLASVVVSAVAPDYGWRTVFGLALVGLAAAIYIMIFVKESPVWLQMHKEKLAREKEAREENVKAPKEGFGQLFSKEYRKRTVVGLLVALFAQFGYWGTAYFMPTHFVQDLGLTTAQAASVIGLGIIINIIGGPIAGIVADKIGRKKTLFIILVFGGAWMIFYVQQQNMTMIYVGIFILFLFIAYPGIVTTWFPEMYPEKLRAMGFGFTFNLARGLTALAPITIGALGGNIGLMSAMIVSGAVYICGGFLALLLPETFQKKDAVEPEATA
jgi:MFS family permease